MDDDMRAWKRRQWGLYLPWTYTHRRDRAVWALASVVVAMPVILMVAGVLWAGHGASLACRQ